MIKYKDLIKLAEDNSFKATLEESSGIISISFKIGGFPILAQADVDNEGVYAIRLPILDEQYLHRLAEVLNA